MKLFTGRIRSRVTGKCLGAKEAARRIENGLLLIKDCVTEGDEAEDQMWMWNKATGRVKALHGMCMQAMDEATVKIRKCDEREKRQK